MSLYYEYRDDQNSVFLIRLKKILKENHQTKFQRVDVLESEEFGKILVLDHIIQLAEKDEPLYHESIVHPALLHHPNPKNVFILGGGDGCTAREVLNHKSVEKVTLVELDQDVLSVVKKYFSDINQHALDDKRLQLIIGDAKKFIEETNNRYDVIISDLTDCTGESAQLYTKEFFQTIKNKLTDNGIFVCHAWETKEPQPSRVIKNTLATVFPSIYPFYVYVPSFFTELVFMLCLKQERPRKTPEEIEEELNKRNLNELKFFDKDAYQRAFSLGKDFKDALHKETIISTADKPYSIPMPEQKDSAKFVER